MNLPSLGPQGRGRKGEQRQVALSAGYGRITSGDLWRQNGMRRKQRLGRLAERFRRQPQGSDGSLTGER